MNFRLIIIIVAVLIHISCNPNRRDEEISRNIEANLTSKPAAKESVDYSDNIEEELTDDPKRVDGRKLPASATLISFYELRDYTQAWTKRKGLNEFGEELVEFINSAPEYGLNPAWYHIDLLNDLLREKKPGAVTLSQIDILLTDAYLQLASHLAYGAMDPGKSKRTFKWPDKSDRGELHLILQQAINDENISKSLKEFQPQWYEYVNLQKGMEKFLAEYEITDKKYEIPDIKTDSAAAYNALSRILVDLKMLNEKDRNSYDKIIEAVKEFQKWNNIPVDGIVGDYTRDALSMSSLDRYNRIALNLDRMRWDAELPDKYVFVNIPSYRLKYVKNNKPEKTFEVIVGTPEDQTPEMTDEMTYIETFPYWHVPTSIVNEEILPKIMNNPSGMSSLGYRIIDENNNEIDPKSFDWSSFSTENFEYSIRQDGDSSNSLGLIKFMFPNKNNIYIHDTPSRHLFEKDMRSFSHGCIRINEPLEFADLILTEDNNKHTANDVRSMIVSRNNRQLKLNEPLPVLIRYYTAEGDEDGRVHLYKDIYSKDTKMISDYLNDQLEKLYSLK